MKNEIDTLFIPEGCPEDCPILQSSQSAALSIAAQAQSLFQGFLQCLHKLDPDNALNPNSKKGTTMVGHFTNKLDKALANEYACNTQCNFVQDGGTCPHKTFKQLNNEIELEQSRYIEVVDQNRQLQDHCNALEGKVDRLLGELSKRRTQYNNRILVEIFVKHYQNLLLTRKSTSFFDLVPREQLEQFLPFLRKIVLGPAIAKKFDADLTEALEPFKDHDGNIELSMWDDIYADYSVNKIMDRVANVLFQRSQRKEAFQSLLQRKFPVTPQKLPTFISLFESMGETQTEQVG